jgi:hypothetical protein
MSLWCSRSGSVFAAALRVAYPFFARMAIGRYRLVRHGRVGCRRVRILLGEGSGNIDGTVAGAIDAPWLKTLKMAVDERGIAAPGGPAPGC